MKGLIVQIAMKILVMLLRMPDVHADLRVLVKRTDNALVDAAVDFFISQAKTVADSLEARNA